MKASKNELRKLMRRTLRGLPVEEIINTSEICQRKVLESTDYLNSRGICCYLSMINELQTKKIIETALSDSKKVYIPKIIGPNPQDMQIHEIYSMEQVDNFPKSSWGIPEPPDEHTCSLDYAEYIDVIYLPGVAFDRNCNRLGHGKAYYDNFLLSVIQQCANLKRKQPIFVGLALDEQIIDDVPVEHHDMYPPPPTYLL